MKKRRCYIYTRVSTSMQVEGYSLEAQKERLRKYADFQEMVIVGEYSDEGKSGKSIEGRQEFMQMRRDIEEGKDRVEFVLITGGIDLSVGSVMALSGTMAASVAVAEKNMPIALVILVGVGLGALCGLINGVGAHINCVNVFSV